VLLDGTRSQYSHSFGNRFVTQLEAKLEDLPVNVRIKTTTVDENKYLCPDSSSKDIFITEYI
jgi:hypothetical protein